MTFRPDKYNQRYEQEHRESESRRWRVECGACGAEYVETFCPQYCCECGEKAFKVEEV